jgi:hypothetical protein
MPRWRIAALLPQISVIRCQGCPTSQMAQRFGAGIGDRCAADARQPDCRWLFPRYFLIDRRRLI